MLVLSRRAHQKIVFPTIQTTVEVLQVRGNVARLGITAPSELPVVRDEVLATDTANGGFSPPKNNAAREMGHLVRNQLNTSSLGLALMRGQLEQGHSQDALATLKRMEAELSAVRDRYEALERRPAPTAHPASRSPRHTALLVEDNQNERELLAGFLRMSGYDVVTAGDGADALDYLASQARPDVMLLDMMMPRCDGPTTLQRIRANPSWEGLKVFAVTGASRCDVQFDCHPGALDGWFSKPIDPPALVRELRRELAVSHA